EHAGVTFHDLIRAEAALPPDADATASRAALRARVTQLKALKAALRTQTRQSSSLRRQRRALTQLLKAVTANRSAAGTLPEVPDVTSPPPLPGIAGAGVPVLETAAAAKPGRPAQPPATLLARRGSAVDSSADAEPPKPTSAPPPISAAPPRRPPPISATPVRRDRPPIAAASPRNQPPILAAAPMRRPPATLSAEPATGPLQPRFYDRHSSAGGWSGDRGRFGRDVGASPPADGFAGEGLSGGQAAHGHGHGPARRPPPAVVRVTSWRSRSGQWNAGDRSAGVPAASPVSAGHSAGSTTPRGPPAGSLTPAGDRFGGAAHGAAPGAAALARGGTGAGAGGAAGEFAGRDEDRAAAAGASSGAPGGSAQSRHAAWGDAASRRHWGAARPGGPADGGPSSRGPGYHRWR
ncbi:unnamed protein product, partial [Symbiodinium sp. KB8]